MRQVAEELFKQCGHLVDVLLLVQWDLQPLVELLAELGEENGAVSGASSRPRHRTPGTGAGGLPDAGGDLVLFHVYDIAL